MGQETRKTVSVVAPCYNEEAVLDAFLERVTAVAARLDAYEFEFLFVDDGSQDATPAMLARRAQEDPRVRMVSLSRNFGHQRAISAGLDFCSGDYIIVMDVDLQDPPELIAHILDLLSRGSDLVHTVRTDRSQDGFVKRFTAKVFYLLMRRWVLPELPKDAGDFKGFNRRVLEACRAHRERVRFLRGTFATLGFEQTSVPYARPARHAGASKYRPFAVLRLARDAVVSYSVLPLRVALLAGLLTWGVLAVLAVALLARGLRSGGLEQPLLWFLALLVMGLGGGILITLGVVGEYLGCMLRELKGRPLYLVRELVNVPPDGARRGTAGQPP